MIGSFLDLDSGFCSYYINGCDLGLTVEFEHPNKTKHRRKKTTSQTSTVASTPSSRSSVTESIATSTTTTTTYQSTVQSTTTGDSPNMSNSSPHTDKRKKPAKGLGLYPAISLTTHQQALVNFGERSWMYPPPTTSKFRGMSEAGALDAEFNKRVMRWVKKRGVTSQGKSYQPMNKAPLRPRVGADDIVKGSSPLSNQESVDSEDTDELDEEEDYDWDGPLCTICFSEPKNTILLPCKHDGIGGRCAKVLTLW